MALCSYSMTLGAWWAARGAFSQNRPKIVL